MRGLIPLDTPCPHDLLPFSLPSFQWQKNGSGIYGHQSQTGEGVKELTRSNKHLLEINVFCDVSLCQRLSLAWSVRHKSRARSASIERRRRESPPEARDERSESFARGERGFAKQNRVFEHTGLPLYRPGVSIKQILIELKSGCMISSDKSSFEQSVFKYRLVTMMSVMTSSWTNQRTLLLQEKSPKLL